MMRSEIHQISSESEAKKDAMLENNSLMKRKKISLNIPDDAKEVPLEFKDLDFDPNSVNFIVRTIDDFRSDTYNFIVKNRKLVKILAIAIAIILYNAYFVTAIIYNRRNNLEWEWCNGHGLLIVLTGLTYWCLFYYHVLKRYFGKAIKDTIIEPVALFGTKLFSIRHAKTVIYLLVAGGIAAFIIADAWETPRRMLSALGVLVMLLIGLLFSKYPGRVQWRQVLGGLGVQLIFALLILRWDGGRNFLECVSRKVTTFLAFSNNGSDFIYGHLSSGSFISLSVIYFFSFIVGLLYHMGIMTWIVMKVGWILQVLLGTTAAESMNAAANIFLGQTEAPILIKPFLNDMTKSELHAVMTGGFATIAGSVMAAYISFGVEASSLLTASVLAAPAALSISKLLYPETQVTKTSATDIKAMKTKSEGNALDAAAQGAAQGFILIGNIVANLIAVISFVAFLNSIIGWFGMMVGQEQLSFEWILSKLFIPFAYILGVDSEDTEDVALLLGLKLVVNEFVAYQRLLSMNLTPRSRRISEYALCSFSNFSSVGIQLGGLSTLAPSRRADFSNVVWRALLAGTLASLLNACVAGALIKI
ncbi:Solute carrier family 28 member 3 [Orchesella cincta]|uniref:Solute carrier family 28 member 3 n=1 Tax=Orchesella cincta TaxID=48709 RepID=A0A1D2MIN5_ORCCI|nr:Solute carrier family 28 member 3 [Orchesella cincta]